MLNSNIIERVIMHVSLKRSLSLLVVGMLTSLPSSVLVAAQDDVVYTWVESGKLEEERQVFLKALKKNFEHLTLEQLGVDNLEAFLNRAFDDEVNDLANKSLKVRFVTARKKGKVVGFASFNLEGNDTIYVRQMSVDPDHWKQGIGKALIYKAREVFSQARTYVLMTRHVNTNAINFYKKLGFKETTYLHEGLDPKKYMGYEYTIPAM